MGSELADAAAALSAGRWSQARDTFAAALAVEESAAAQHGLGQALWWLGDTDQAVQHITDAYAGFRRCRDLAGAVQCAVWLAIVHQANFGNAAVANGWARRAERLLDGEPPGVLHGWALVARAYRNPDTPQAEALTTRALDLAREADNVDLELVALAQLGRILVGRGDPAVGFALLDEAVAASLGGERSSLDTVAYTCCDMLSACEQVSDLDRARQWSAAADAFVERFGCPFLYAECRIAYGSVLVDRGRWTEAERELAAGLHTSGTSAPALRVRAQARLAELRIRQGEWESAAELLGEPSEQPELTLARASLALARAEPGTARNLIEHQRPAIADPRLLAASLGLLVEACLAVGLVAEATAHVEQLCSLAADREHVLITAQAAMAEGRLCLAVGSRPDAHQRLVAAESALAGAGPPVRAGWVSLRARPIGLDGAPGGGCPLCPSRSWSLHDLGSGVGGRPDCRAAPRSRRCHTRWTQGSRRPDGPGAGGVDPARPRTQQSRDRRPAARQPEDRGAPRQPRPDQAGPAQPGVGRGVRGPECAIGQLPDASGRTAPHAGRMGTPAASQTPESFAIPLETAERYEELFVPAFFAQWVPMLCDAAHLRRRPARARRGLRHRRGDPTAASRVEPGGRVIGLDLNEAMLRVARRVSPRLDFRHGDAASLPFPDQSFDVVLSQMALMFFPDPGRSLAEIGRVLRPGGTAAVLVPGPLEHQPGFAPFVASAARHVGPDALDLLTTYFTCGDAERLTGRLAATGLREIQVSARSGWYRAPSAEAMVRTEVDSTPLGQRIDEGTYRRLRYDAIEALTAFIRADGTFAAPFECLVATGHKEA